MVGGTSFRCTLNECLWLGAIITRHPTNRTTMTAQHFLTTIFKAKDFSNEELETIISKFKQGSFSKNEYLLKEGKIENHYWFVESGFVRSYVADTEGNDITTNFYAVGDIVIDWTSFFLRNPTRENIQALTDCVCWQLDPALVGFLNQQA